MLIKSACCAFSVLLEENLLETAMLNEVTEIPFWVCFSSGSAVRLPMRMTLLNDAIALSLRVDADGHGAENTFGDVETYAGLERMWLSKAKPDVNCDYVIDGKTISAEISQEIIEKYESNLALVTCAYDSKNSDKLLYVTITPYESENKIIVDYSTHKTYSSDIKAMLWDMKNLKPVSGAVEIK